jgi:hypothetical protein
MASGVMSRLRLFSSVESRPVFCVPLLESLSTLFSPSTPSSNQSGQTDQLTSPSSSPFSAVLGPYNVSYDGLASDLKDSGINMSRPFWDSPLFLNHPSSPPTKNNASSSGSWALVPVHEFYLWRVPFRLSGHNEELEEDNEDPQEDGDDHERFAASLDAARLPYGLPEPYAEWMSACAEYAGSARSCMRKVGSVLSRRDGLGGGVGGVGEVEFRKRVEDEMVKLLFALFFIFFEECEKRGFNMLFILFSIRG